MLSPDKYLSPEEDTILDAWLKLETGEHALVIRMLRRTGARVSEVLNIRPMDVNPTTKSVWIRGLKNSMSRELPLSEKDFEDFWNLSRTQVLDDQPVFGLSYVAVKRYWYKWFWHPNIYARYRRKPKTLHCLRHTLGIETYRKTRDIHLVSRILGHKNITNTMIYLNFIYSQEEFRKALLPSAEPISTQTEPERA